MSVPTAAVQDAVNSDISNLNRTYRATMSSSATAMERFAFISPITEPTPVIAKEALNRMNVCAGSMESVVLRAEAASAIATLEVNDSDDESDDVIALKDIKYARASDGPLHGKIRVRKAKYLHKRERSKSDEACSPQKRRKVERDDGRAGWKADRESSVPNAGSHQPRSHE